jgi:hypothetical protein
METPAVVPNSDAKMYWLVFLAVMSAAAAAAAASSLVADGRT